MDMATQYLQIPDVGIPVGTIAQFAVGAGDTYLTGNNWLKCDGSTVSQSTYATLYSHIGLVKTFAGSWTLPAKANTTSWNGIATDGTGNLYVLVSSGGVVNSSTDLVTLTSRTSGTASALNGVTYGNGIFCAVGAGGVVIKSTDGTTWTSSTSNTTSALNAVNYVNSLFLAVGAGGAVITSADGTTWSARTSNTTSALGCVGFGNSLYLAGGAVNCTLKSTDGTTWSNVTPATLPQSNTLNGGAFYFASQYVFLGGASIMVTSTDLVTFSSVAFSPYSTNSVNNCTIVANSIMVITNNSGSVYTTTDLVNYSFQLQRSNSVNGACVDSSRMVITGANGYIAYTSNSVYSYNTATSFVLPNLNPTVNPLYQVGQNLQNIILYYIKAL